MSVATQPRAHAAILEATERLLRERPLSQLSVADIIEEASVSRASFYAYFSSKTAVIAEALRSVMDEVMVAVRPFHAQEGGDTEAAIRVSLRQWVEIGKTHGALLRTVSEEWSHDAEIRALWFATLETVTAGTARVISSARAGGGAPGGADPRALAACLMWGYERVLHVALVGDAVGLPDPDAIIEPLAQMMVGGLYGQAPAPRP
ncbi:MAG TPA: TetR/AcrR family transcriptional regulator [Solirubrobacteraceae bacterium]|nr:TetR/AcrR family transcriptional regulator [Solirubrobacteraceae bacterium]